MLDVLNFLRISRFPIQLLVLTIIVNIITITIIIVIITTTARLAEQRRRNGSAARHTLRTKTATRRRAPCARVCHGDQRRARGGSRGRVGRVAPPN